MTIEFSNILHRKGWIANAAQTITCQQCNGGFISLSYVIYLRDKKLLLGKKNLDNYSKTIVLL